MRWLLLFLFCAGARAGEIALPQRPPGAPRGSEFAKSIVDLSLAEREQRITQEILGGNVPTFWRSFQTLHLGDAEIQVAPDYLCVGSDEDFFLTPVTPDTAQAIADALDCILPTTKIVDEIYRAAAIKLAPQPIAPSAAMTTVPVFIEHNRLVSTPRAGLIAGHKKDLVITPRLATAPGKVAIYGWHKTNGAPIQPLYVGHTSQWVDYSHGARLIQRQATLSNQPTRIDQILADPNLCALLSDEGPILSPRYGLDVFQETNVELKFDPGVRAVINSSTAINTNNPVRLVLYALPNGNTIEQTMGRALKPGDDWHFDIQHIGAQTRWLRRALNDSNLVIVYLECAEKAWPVWRRKHDPDNQRIPEIVNEFRTRFKGPTTMTLTGHSGGGSFTFGFLDGIQEIPDAVERIAFLDSNYAYKTEAHAKKIARWLNASKNHALCVLAYHDSIALLNGKTFVSEQGGTWGRSHAMFDDLKKSFGISSSVDEEWKRHSGLEGRLQLLLKTNPEKKIFHTVQVERNGFIHAMLTGTPGESRGYSYFGPRAYGGFIREH